MKFGFVLIILLSLAFEGCSSGGGGPVAKTAAQLTVEGWQAYSTKSYPAALDKFTSALQIDGNFVDALNGSGWANAKLGNLAAARSALDAGNTKDPANLQIKAGLAFTAGVQKDYSSSIQFANEVLASDSSWSFSRDLSISAPDVHLLLAADYFAQGNFELSLAQVQSIDDRSFSVNWSTASGQGALALEIERLRTRV